MKSLSAKRFGVLLLAVVLCVSLALPVLAAEPVVYSGDDLYPGRTRAEIGQHYATALAAGSTYQDRNAASYYSTQASTTAPYAAGTLTTDTHAAMTAMTDYYRWLVGVQALQTGSVGSESLQKAALVRNWDFNHVVSSENKPADMDDALWNEGAGVWHNILALGYTPRGAVNGWLNEGYDLDDGTWDTIGHRAALLDSDVSALQYGYSGRVAIGLITERRNSMTAAFAAFPAAGDMPLTDVRARASAWTVELNTAKLRCPTTAIVTVTNTVTGENYTCTEDNGKLHTGSTLSFVQPAPAEGAAYYADGDSFRVEITGLTDVATGGEAKIDYTVRFFDVRDYTPTTVTGAKPVGWGSLHIPESFTGDETLRKLAAILPDTVQVQTAVGRTVTLPVKGAWKVDTENGCWTNSADAGKLPAEVTDPNGVLNDIRFFWKTENYTGSFSASNATGFPGTSGVFSVWRYISNFYQTELYQVTACADGTYHGEQRFDNESPNFHADDDGWYQFDMTSWSGSDNGDWFAIYYSSEPYWNEAWVAGICTVHLACAHTQTALQTTPATCTEPGTKATVCTDCGAIIAQETIPAAGHKWDSGVVTTEPTETAEGVKTFTCTVCGEKRTETIPQLSHTHSYTSVVTQPTCTAQGYTTHTCACGDSYVDSYVNPLGHKWDSGVVTKEPTETATGVRTYTCTVCGARKTESISKLPPQTVDPQPPAPTNPFVDVAADAYYYDAVLWAVNHKPYQITNGMTPTTFEPDATCKRGQVVTFLWRAMGQPEPTSTVNPFVDVQPTDYFYKAVLWANEKGITNGTSAATFSPEDPCTRAHVVTFLWRAHEKPAAGIANPFTDVPAGQYYTDAVLWAVEENITQGMGGGLFSPDGPCRRGQIVTFLYRDKKLASQ